MRTSPQIAFVQRDFPVGGIAVWSGAIVDIPSTFRLCDGTDGTPDLRDKFIVGAGNTYAKGAVSGMINHNHIFTSNTHQHIINVGSQIAASFAMLQTISSETATGTTDNQNGLPPYYSLAYIMYKGVPI